MSCGSNLNGISPWVAGQTSPTWTITCQRGQNVFDLTGQIAADISIIFYNNIAPSFPGSYTRVGVGVGTVTIISANPGIIHYVPAATDTLTLPAGQYYIRVEVLFGGTNPDYCDYLPLLLQA